MSNVVTLVLNISGSLHLASDKISTSDAERWAAEGKIVFRLAVERGCWAVNHVNSGKVVGDAYAPGDPPSPAVLKLNPPNPVIHEGGQS